MHNLTGFVTEHGFGGRPSSETSCSALEQMTEPTHTRFQVSALVAWAATLCLVVPGLRASPSIVQHASPVSAPRRVIIDTDPGIDDAIAILLALRSPELHIEALTVVAGNVTVDRGSQNALKLLSFAGRTNIPVSKGAAHPLRKSLRTATYWHGPNGIGGIDLPNPTQTLDRRRAPDLMIELAHAHPHDLTVLAIGPLTNVALALQKAPSLKRELSEIIVMGGSTVEGNETAAAEFNFYVDPDAAQIVFESGVPITMVGLNATRQTLLTRKHIERLEASNNCLGRIVAKLGAYYLKTADEFPLHDPLVVALSIDKRLARQTSPMRIEIDTRDGLTNGASVYNASLTRPHVVREDDHYTDAGVEPVTPNAEVPTRIDSQRFLSLLMDRLTTADNQCTL